MYQNEINNGASKTIKFIKWASDSKFVTRKWNIANDQSNVSYDVGNKIVYNTDVLKSNFCDNNDFYILLRGDISVTVAPATQVSFKNHAPCTMMLKI